MTDPAPPHRDPHPPGPIPRDTATPAIPTDWVGVGYGLALAVMAAYQQFKLPPLLQAMSAEYGYDPMLAGAFMSVYAVAGLALSLWVGRAIGRDGSALWVDRAFWAILAGTALSLLLPTPGWTMLAGRTLEGLGATILAIAGPVHVNMNARGRALPLAYGLTALWIPAGQVGAILAGQIALALGHWQVAWGVGLLATAVLMLWTRALAAARRVDLDARPAGTATGGAAAIRPAERWALVLTGLTFCLWSTQFIAYMTWLPSFLVAHFGIGAAMATWAYAIPVVTLGAFNLIGGWWLRLGVPASAMLTGSILVQAGVWLALPITGTGADGLASLLVYGVASGLIPTCLFAMPTTILGPGRGGPGAFAIVMTGRNLGVFVGPLLMGAVLNLTGDWLNNAPIFAAITVACAASALALGLSLRHLKRG